MVERLSYLFSKISFFTRFCEKYFPSHKSLNFFRFSLFQKNHCMFLIHKPVSQLIFHNGFVTVS